MKKWNITEIEAITEEKARELATEMMVIKEHNVYFVDFGKYFGYSCLVFANGHHIHYANDYALHHSGKSVKELKKWYIEALNDTLFTETEIAQPLHSYDEYSRKLQYINNYYGMREDHLSIFCINPTEKQKEEYDKAKKEKVYNPIAFAYYDNDEFVTHHIELYNKLRNAKENMTNDYEYQKSAFLSEMYNHEYGYNWQGDYDVLSVFGNITYTEESDDLERYFKQLNFTNLQKKAYREARKEYFKKTEL